MDEKTRANLRDAGCGEGFIAEYAGLPSDCSRLCRLKAYRRELLAGIHTGQRKLECLDYLIYQLRCGGELGSCCPPNPKGE